MWDKFRGAVPQKLGRSHQNQHSQQQAQQFAHVYNGGGHSSGGYSYAVQGGPPPGRPPREFVEPQTLQYTDDHSGFYPAQPPQSSSESRRQSSTRLEPPSQPRDPRFRPVSSVYSHASPIQTDFAHSAPSNRYAHNDAHEISPPSSPEPFTPSGNGIPHAIPDISPIDEDEEEYASMSQQPVRGGIPSLRRERRQKADAATSATLRGTRSREQMRTPQAPQPQSGRGYHGGEVRWDPATGELTSSEKGRPSQVKPAEYAKEFEHSPESERLGVGAGAGPGNPSTTFGERVRRIAPPGFVTGGAERKVSAQESPSTRRLSPSPSPSPRHSPRHATAPPPSYDPAAGAFTADRPPWKGASGRTALVDPVHDNPEIGPLNLPPKSTKRGLKSPTATNPPAMASPPVSPLSSQTQPQPPGPTIRQVITPSHAPLLQDPATNAASDYPSPPRRGSEAIGQNHAETTSIRPNAPPALSPSTLSPTAGIRRKPAPTSQLHRQQDGVNHETSQGDPDNYGNYAAEAPSPGPTPDGWTQPPSRFSISTYATSANATPRPSADGFDGAGGAQSVPPAPNSGSLTDTRGADSTEATKQESVMDRRRPKLRDGGGDSPAGDGEPIVISLKDVKWRGEGGVQRKPLGPGAGNAAGKDDRSDVMPTGPPKNRPESISSMAGSIYKSLPPAPPETSAVDRVDALNARLRALANRRINITRSVKQMTELMPTDNIMASDEVLRRRELERRKVDALRVELAEVQREEYELGIKLHRAYKRIDREATFEPTTLWVRRVTG